MDFDILCSTGVARCGICQSPSYTCKMEGLSYDTIWFGTTLGRKPVIKQHSLKNQDGSFDIHLNEGVSPGFTLFL